MNKLTFSVKTIRELITIDVDAYQEFHEDLKGLSRNELYQHYAAHGYREGRVCHRLALGELFIDISKKLKCLEIGPFTSPAIRHDNVKYLDVLSTTELHERAQKLGMQSENIPDINFVTKDGSLSLVNENFDVIFSSHNLEHQPDLISHLNEASAILNKDGVYKMIVPNSAYCFDADLSTSKISEIILANRLKLKSHSLSKVIEHRALTVHNESLEHWKDAFKSEREYIKIDTNRISAAINEYENAKGGYIDVHSWQFQPHTLSDILKSLINLNFISFTNVRCYGPVFGRNDFCIEMIM